jgi:hypothetical protein
MGSIIRIEKYVKREMTMKQAASRCWFLLGLLFYPEDEGDMFL